MSFETIRRYEDVAIDVIIVALRPLSYFASAEQVTAAIAAAGEYRLNDVQEVYDIDQIAEWADVNVDALIDASEAELEG